LNVDHAEAGPVDGAPVILLHGWPYDICSFVDVGSIAVVEGQSGDRSAPAGAWDDALSFQ
jgi:hypothetical protein